MITVFQLPVSKFFFRYVIFLYFCVRRFFEALKRLPSLCATLSRVETLAVLTAGGGAGAEVVPLIESWLDENSGMTYAYSLSLSVCVYRCCLCRGSFSHL